jgi:hypothetical protein
VDLFRPAYFEVSEISAGHQRFEVRYPIHHRGCLFASQLATRSHILASLCEVSRQCGGHGLNRTPASPGRISRSNSRSSSIMCKRSIVRL